MANIAIDGPAGAGKSTVAKMLARKLGYVYIDTGAMYRALTLKAIENNIDIKDEQTMTKLANQTNIELQPGNPQKIYLDERLVTDEIRRPDVSRHVSMVSQHKGVRDKLVAVQQKIASRNKVVMDGRDIGTRVLPNAKYKFFLDAALNERADRRYKELLENGYQVSKEEIEVTLSIRDNQDSSRKNSPLIQAQDAILIDTTSLSAENVVEIMCRIVRGG
ncbi:MAG: cytidylate kinase [Desulfitibacter sp. BRH_c19]|nr:MAG: cytidylate kinase [Desulfitibacter sp. BRH_c19]